MTIMDTYKSVIFFAGFLQVCGASHLPHVILFLVDDLGSSDVGAFGNTSLRTPNVDSICYRGVKLNHDLSSAATCCPSRASLLTGRYPQRTGISEILITLMDDRGIDRREWTVPRMLQHQGYSTALIGKWHLGWHSAPFDRYYHPKNFGFDYFFGIPYSIIKDFDGVQKLPLETGLAKTIFSVAVVGVITSLFIAKFVNLKLGIFCLALCIIFFGSLLATILTWGTWNSMLVKNDRIVEMPIDLTTITQRLINEGQQFLRTQHAAGKPVFLMMSWLHVHSCLHPQPPFQGSSNHGAYGDAVQETDWAIGQIMSTLKELDIAEDTLVIFSSDHGGDKHDLDQNGRMIGGWNGIFKGGKGDGGQEGGIRVPTCLHWPKELPSGLTVNSPTSQLDLLPTLAAITGSRLPKDRIYDGVNILPVLKGDLARTEREFLFHYTGTSLSSVRYSPKNDPTVYKLHYTWPQWVAGKDVYDNLIKAFWYPPKVLNPPQLFNILNDPREDRPLDTSIQPHSDVVKKIQEATEIHRESLAGIITEKRTLLQINTKFWRNSYFEYLWQNVQDELTELWK